jgi:hypothetical protein
MSPYRAYSGFATPHSHREDHHAYSAALRQSSLNAYAAAYAARRLAASRQLEAMADMGGPDPPQVSEVRHPEVAIIRYPWRVENKK